MPIVWNTPDFDLIKDINRTITSNLMHQGCHEYYEGDHGVTSGPDSTLLVPMALSDPRLLPRQLTNILTNRSAFVWLYKEVDGYVILLFICLYHE